MLNIEELEALEVEVDNDPTLKAFIASSLTETRGSIADRSGQATVTRTGVEIAALWSLGLATLMVLRHLGLLGGSRRSQASDTSAAAQKIGEAVELLRAKGFNKQQAITTVQAMYRNAGEHEDNLAFMQALTGKTVS